MASFFKLSMFFMSFLPLWCCIAISNFVHIYSYPEEKDSLYALIIIILITICVCVSSLKIALSINKINQISGIRYTLVSAKKSGELTAGFIAAYTLPLFVFKFYVPTDLLQFLVFWASFAFICIRNDYIYHNIYLEIIGYTIYSCCLSSDKDIEDLRGDYESYENPQDTKILTENVTVISSQNLASMIGHTIKIVDLDTPFHLHIVYIKK